MDGGKQYSWDCGGTNRVVGTNGVYSILTSWTVGRMINKDGVRPIPAIVTVNTELKPTENIQELKRALCMVNYPCKY